MPRVPLPLAVFVLIAPIRLFAGQPVLQLERSQVTAHFTENDLARVPTQRSFTWVTQQINTPHDLALLADTAAPQVAASYPIPCDKCDTGERITYAYDFGVMPATGTAVIPYIEAKSDGSPEKSYVGLMKQDGSFLRYATPDPMTFNNPPFGSISTTSTVRTGQGRWAFSSPFTNSILEFKTDGTMTTIPYPKSFASPSEMIYATNGYVYGVAPGVSEIFKWMPGTTTFQRVTIPSRPFALMQGSDFNVWFLTFGNTVGSVSLDLASRGETALPANSGAQRIVPAYDGTALITAFSSRQILQMPDLSHPSMPLNVYPTAGYAPFDVTPKAPTTRPDGTRWQPFVLSGYDDASATDQAATAHLQIGKGPDLEISKVEQDSLNGAPPVGTVLHFRLVVFNVGEGKAGPVTIEDQLGDSLQLDSYTPATPGVTCTPFVGGLRCLGPDADETPNRTIAVDLYERVTKPGPIRTSAWVSATRDVRLENNRDEITVQPRRRPTEFF